MNAAILQRLMWKEYRFQRSFWLATLLLALCAAGGWCGLATWYQQTVNVEDFFLLAAVVTSMFALGAAGRCSRRSTNWGRPSSAPSAAGCSAFVVWQAAAFGGERAGVEVRALERGVSQRDMVLVARRLALHDLVVQPGFRDGVVRLGAVVFRADSTAVAGDHLGRHRGVSHCSHGVAIFVADDSLRRAIRAGGDY